MRADAKANQQDIIQAAMRLFATRGPTASLRQVAEAAGVGIGTLYRHFPERKDLLLGIADDTAGKMLPIITQALESWSEDPERVWAQCVQDMGALRTGALAASTNMFVELGTTGPKELEVRRHRILKALEPLIRRAQHHKLVSRDVGPAQFLLGLATVTRPFVSDDNPLVPQHELDAWLLEVYRRGLRPEPKASGHRPLTRS